MPSLVVTLLRIARTQGYCERRLKEGETRRAIVRTCKRDAAGGLSLGGADQ